MEKRPHYKIGDRVRYYRDGSVGEVVEVREITQGMKGGHWKVRVRISGRIDELQWFKAVNLRAIKQAESATA